MTAYRFDRCQLDTQRRELRVDDAPVRVEPQVFEVLVYLLANRARVVTKSELFAAIWHNQFVSESALSSRIKLARAAIGDDGTSQRLIRTERGYGYRFVGDVHVEHGGLAANDPRSDGSSRSLDGVWAPTGALPASRSPLVGRVADLDALDELLARHRTVTITGPGGVGKSTLALELARRLRDAQGIDVAWIELAPARDRADVVRVVAEATGVENVLSSDVSMLAAHLSKRALLLVLDNCEHLLDPSAELVNAVLDAGIEARIVTTSREPLGVDGEAVHVLGPLGADAAALFVARAAAATGRSPMRADDPRVVDICERLDGLPLALELAAAQLRHLTVDELAARLDDRLQLLVGGRPRAGDRHATLAATIEWSYQLLSGGSRSLFERLGVFPASFDVAAARAVSAGLDLVGVTNAIGDLVAKSLVTHDHTTGRYRLLETIRLFAADRLDAAGLRAEVAEQLRSHVVARTQEGSRPWAWLSGSLAARSREDFDNVRVSVKASVAAGRLGDAVDLALGLGSLWRNAMSFGEGLRWVALLRECALSPRDELWLNIVEADLGIGSGNPRLMADAARRAAELVVRVDDPGAAAITGIYRALSAASQPEQVVKSLEVARERAEKLGEPALAEVADGFRIAFLVAAGRRSELGADIEALTASTGDGYERYISTWAAWVVAMADRDGPRMAHRIAHQLENERYSGLPSNWLTLFCRSLTLMAQGLEHRPLLRQARARSQAEGRVADADCVLALAYAAACDESFVEAAELVGACGGALFHDTGNYIHYLVIKDQVVRPQLTAEAFGAALARGAGRSIATILAASDL